MVIMASSKVLPDLPLGWRITNRFQDDGTMYTFESAGIRYSSLLLQRAQVGEDAWTEKETVVWTTVSKRAVPMSGVTDSEMDAFVHSLVTEAQYQMEAEALLLETDNDDVLTKEDGWETAR